MEAPSIYPQISSQISLYMPSSYEINLWEKCAKKWCWFRLSSQWQSRNRGTDAGGRSQKPEPEQIRRNIFLLDVKKSWNVRFSLAYTIGFGANFIRTLSRYVTSADISVTLMFYSCLENPMDRGAATVLRVSKSQTWLKWHSRHPCSPGSPPSRTAKSVLTEKGLGPPWLLCSQPWQCPEPTHLHRIFKGASAHPHLTCAPKGVTVWGCHG